MDVGYITNFIMFNGVDVDVDVVVVDDDDVVVVDVFSPIEWDRLP